jgi:hypothetical protein
MSTLRRERRPRRGARLAGVGGGRAGAGIFLSAKGQADREMAFSSLPFENQPNL